MKKKKTLDSCGQGLTEYLILLVLVAILSISATQSLGKLINNKLKIARKHINEKVVFEDD